MLIHALMNRLPEILEWYLLSGPLCGGLNTLLVGQLRRRRWVWFVVGYGLNILGVMVMGAVWLRTRPGPPRQEEELD